MAQGKEPNVDLDAVDPVDKSSQFARIGRMILCVLSMGLIYPNAFTEGVNIQEYEARNNQPPK